MIMRKSKIFSFAPKTKIKYVGKKSHVQTKRTKTTVYNLIASGTYTSVIQMLNFY